MKNRNTLRTIYQFKTLIIIFLIVVFLALSSKLFLRYGNIVNIFSAITIQGIITIGMTILIILGELDLSVGVNMNLCAVIAIHMQKYGVFASIFSGLGVGIAIGLVNGLVVTKMKISSIAHTLAMMVGLNGLVFALTNSQTVRGTNNDLMAIFHTSVFRIPIAVFYFIVLVAFFQFLLKFSFWGRNIYAVGGNKVASEFFGIKVDRIRISAFAVTGFLAGLAGVLLAAKLNVASGILGIDTPILVITAVLLGGVSLSGGEGSVLMAFQGLLLIGVLNNAMTFLRISPYLQVVIRGLLLVGIVVIDAINIRREKYK